MRALGVVLLSLSVAGCASVPLPALTQTRPLSQAEKTALAASLSQTMKDPGAAQFKWMPVIAREGDAPIGYCGQVNGKNSYGGYEGYRQFFAMISKGPRDEFDRGSIVYIHGREVTLFGNSTTDDAVANGLTEGSCQKWGYPDVSAAQ